MRFLTEDRCQLLPRGGQIPRPLRALAISLRVFAPAFRIARITGTRFAAKSSAACAWAMRPREPATQRFEGLPSLAPARFLCSQRGFSSLRNQPAFLFRQGSVQVQHEWVRVSA